MKYFAMLFVAALVSIGANAQKKVEMRDVLKQMPDTIFSYLSTNNKLDMIDFIDSHMKANVTNAFDGTTTLDTLTNNYLKMSLTPASTLEMRLLPFGNKGAGAAGQVVCMVITYGDKVKESEVRFYSTEWKLLGGIGNPISHDKLLRYAASDPTIGSDVQKIGDFLCAEASLSPSDCTLVAKLALPVYVADNKIYTKSLDVSKTFKWDGGAFKEL